MPSESADTPHLGISITGSNLTAVAAELLATVGPYREMKAITRRSTQTSLPVLFDGDAWGEKLKKMSPFSARGQIRAFQDEITRLTQGEKYDCFLHHSKDPFSQLLAGHPLCRRFFYLEEGFTALTGNTFGRTGSNQFQKLLWRVKSPLFYSRLIDKYRSFFDTKDRKYGGVYALSKHAFKGFPGRIQLPANEIIADLPLPGEIVIFLDSQYFLGNCTEEAYTRALLAGLVNLLDRPTQIAMKFHPSETLPERKQRIMESILGLPDVAGLTEVPGDFIGERMTFAVGTRILVGTSAIGYFLGERGFSSFSFAPRLKSASEKYGKMLKQIPPEFSKVCQSI